MPITKDFVLSSQYPDVITPIQSLPDFVLEEFERFGDEIAFVFTPTGQKYSFADVRRIVKNLSKGLKKRYNLQKGDVVATVVSNCPEFFFLFLAVQRLGAILTTANPAYTAEEMENQFAGASVGYILTEDEFFSKVKEVARKLKNFRDIIFVRKSNDSGSFVTLSDLIEIGKKSQALEFLPFINPMEDVACILYSSGTTGLPKGVMLTHYSMVANLCQTTMCRQPKGARIGMVMPHRGEVTYVPFPYFHLGGIYMGLLWPLVQGAAIICMPKYHPEEFLQNIEKYHINALILPPPIQVFLAKSPLVANYNLSSIRIVIAGAAPVSKEIAEEVLERLPNVRHVVQIYGMTELSPLCHSSPLTTKSRQKLQACGTLTPSTYCKIVNTETGKICGPHQDGEIWIKGPQVMKGYLNNEKATKDMITEDGWLKTGDIGYFDEDEYFYISDRLKELIKVKGFQVAPAELEALILTHPAVAEVIVVGIPDPYAGELPRAYVVLKPNHSATAAEIQKHVAGHVISYKRLAGGVIFMDEVPKTGSGKLLRRELRDKAREEILSKKSKL